MKPYSLEAVLIGLALTPLVIWMFRSADRQLVEAYLSKRGRQLLLLEEDISGLRWLGAHHHGSSYYVMTYRAKNGKVCVLRCSLCFSSVSALQRGTREWRTKKCTECKARSE